MEKKLKASANTILEHSNFILKEADRLKLDNMKVDLAKIRSSAEDLVSRVDTLLQTSIEKGSLKVNEIEKGLQKKMRHDLLSPTTAIKGFGEILLEDLIIAKRKELQIHFNKLLDETNAFISYVDIIFIEA